MANKVNRAAQFLPFDALKGLHEELRAREQKHTSITRKEISEEAQEAISNALLRITVGARVRIVFYYSGHYYDIEGEITSYNNMARYLVLGQSKIFYDDIYSIILL